MNLISVLRHSIMGNEGGKLTSYDDLCIDEHRGGTTSDIQGQGASLDSRLLNITARRTTSIVFGWRRTGGRQGYCDTMGDRDVSSDDDSGGFRSDVSDSDTGGFEAHARGKGKGSATYTGVAGDRSRMRGILKARKLRHSKKDTFEESITKYESHLSVTSIDGKGKSNVKGTESEIIAKESIVNLSGTPRSESNEGPKARTSRSPMGEHGHTSKKDGSGTSEVNSDAPQPHVRTSKQPPSPPPRSSSYRDTLGKPELFAKSSPPPPAPPPPPVPERGLRRSTLLAQIHDMQKTANRDSLLDNLKTDSVSKTDGSLPTVTSVSDKRRPGNLAELEQSLSLLESPRRPVVTPRSPISLSRMRVTPVTTPRDLWRTGAPANIDTFVPSSPRVEMSQDLKEDRSYIQDPISVSGANHRSPTRPQFRKSSDIANLYLYGARGFRRRPEQVSSISTSSDSALQEVEGIQNIYIPPGYFRPPVPFARRILTGNVHKLTKRFEKSISHGTSKVEHNSYSSEEEPLSTSVRLRRLFRREFDDAGIRRSGKRFLTVGPSGDIVQRGPWPTLYKDPESPKRLSGSLGRHDTDLELLVREGEAVSTRLRNLLTHNLSSPRLPSGHHLPATSVSAAAGGASSSTSFRPRRSASTESPRHHSLERLADGSSRLSRADLTFDDSVTSPRHDPRSFPPTLPPRTRSLTDVRRSDLGSSTIPLRPPGTTSTPLKSDLNPPGGGSSIRARRELFSATTSLGGGTTDVMDDPEMYRLEEETRYLQSEVGRLEEMLVTSRSERDRVSVQYNALSDHVADEWQDYQKRLEYFHEVHRKQTSLIDRLANKVREYRGRNRELESRHTETSRFREGNEREIETLNLALTTAEEKLRASEAQHTFDLETALVKLEDEQHRCQDFNNKVCKLQEQMSKLELNLSQVTEERDKAQLALKRLADDVKAKEEQWVSESQQFNSYYISEHKNLLDLWREIGSVKRTFSEVKHLTSRDLTELRGDLDRFSHLLSSACQSAQSNMSIIPTGDKDDYVVANPSDLWGRIQDCERSQVRAETEKSNLKEKINELNSRVAELNNGLRDKERTIHELNKKLDEGMSEAEIQETLREKVRTLETYMVDIAQTVIKDSEQTTNDADGKTPSAFRIVRDSDQSIAPDLPQSTVSAVRTALSNRQIQIHELQLKLTSSKDQLSVLRKQYDTAESAQRSLEGTISELRDDMESLARQKDEIIREKDRLTEDLDQVISEKSVLEKSKQTLKSQLEAAEEDAERRARQVTELEKEKTALGEERTYLNSKLLREKEEVQKHVNTITVLNSEFSSVQHQVTILSESLGKVRAAEEKLDQEKDVLRDQIRGLERHRTEMEAKLAHSLRQETDLREALEKVESYSINLGQDKSQLVSKITALETERAALGTERAELRTEIERLKDDLAALEEERSSHETTISTLNEKITLLTIDKEKIELELNDVISERHELHGQLTQLERIKTALENELTSVTNNLTEKVKLIERLNSEKEELTKENAELEVRLTGAEKELGSLKDSMTTLKAEKQSLESFATSLEKKWSNNEARRTQLEKENQQLTSDKERLNTQMNKLQRELEGELAKLRESRTALERRLDEKETEHKKMLMALRNQYEESLDDLRKEKNNIQLELEDKLNSTIHSMKMERDELEQKKDQEISSLKRYSEKLQRERDDSTLRFEEEKHRSMMLAQQEISSLEEKVSALQRDLSSYETHLEQLRRDGTSKAEAGRASEGALHNKISQLKEELHNNSQHFDKQLKDEKDSFERRIRELQARLDESRRDHEVEVTSLKTDMRLAREDASRLTQDLEVAEEKLREAEDTRVALKKELNRTNEEMRASEERRSGELQALIKKVDLEKMDLQKRLDDKETKLSGLEVSEAKHADLIARMTAQLRELNTVKQDARREISELKKKQQLAETEAVGRGQELENLRLRLSAEEDRHNECRKEASKLKTKVAEYERERDNLQTELALLERRLTELEDHHAAKEQELATSLEESRANERKMNDERKNLENYLNNANQQISDLKVKLSREEGRVEALEQQLNTLDTSREQLERKLQNVYASLRTVTRMYQDTTPSSPALRSRKGNKIGFELSGSHSDLQASIEALGSTEKINVAEIDPETVRHELRALMTQMNQVELERDDAMAHVSSLERQLAELQDVHQKSETRLRDVTRALSELEEKKRYSDDKLNKALSHASQQDEMLRRKEAEIRAMNEELSNTRRKITDLEHEKATLDDRVQKLKNAVNRIEIENADIKEKLRTSEQRGALLDDSKSRLEAELSNTKKAISEKQMEIENLHSNKDNVNRTIRSLEDQNLTLKNRVEDLKTRMAVVSNSEADLKNKLASINRSLKESVSSSSSMQEELSRAQNQFSRSDAERRQLEERVADLQSAVGDLKRQKEQLSEFKSKAQQDLSNAEIKNAELEMSLKSLKGNLGERSSATDELVSKVARLEQEKLDLRSQLSHLERKLAVYEAEKRDIEKSEYRLEKDKSDLKKILEKYEHERQDRPDHHRPDHILTGSEQTVHDSNLSALRVENMELRRKIDDLETSKTDLQQKHLKETLEMSSDHRRERQLDSEKIRRLTSQLENLRQEKERCELRIHSLEQQIAQYRDQIREYRSRSSAVAADVRRVRMSMTESLHNIGTHPRVSTGVVDSEIQSLSGRQGRSPRATRQRRYASASPGRRSDQPRKTLTFT